VSEPKRYNEEMVNISNGDPCGEIEFDYSASMVEAFEGRWVAWEDYAELKAEAERYRLASLRVDVSELHAQFNRALFDDTIAENARLKAEVERLELEVFAFDRTIKQASCHYDNRLEDIRQLQAQVERLTKAGDAMDAYLKRQDGTTNGMLDCRRLWHAAKEGKPCA